MPRGFSLLEVTIAIAILFLLTAGVMGVSFSYLKNQQARTATDAVTAELSRAQADAYAQTNDAGHGIKVFTDRVVRFEGSTYATRTTSKDITTPFSVTVTISGTTEFDFANGSLTPTASGTLTIQQDGTAVDISVSSYGVIQTTARAI